jgi:PhoH-like ATPase
LSKKFVIDTSVLLYDVDCLYKFEDNEVIIPSIVYEEINKFKEENSERGYSARQISNIFDELSQSKPLKEGVKLNNTLIKTSYELFNKEVSNLLTMNENDYKIIACAKNNDAILISRDRMMRVIARDFVKVQEYKADKVKTKELYKGYRKVVVPENTITEMHQRKLNNEFGLFPNEFIIMENEINPQHISVGINKNNKIIPCDFDKMSGNLRLKLKPINLEQKMFMYLLLDNDIKCVTCSGVSGKGKSLLAVDYALEAIKNQLFNKFLFTKSTIDVDKRESLGFYKGGLNEKLQPHLQPLYSSIEFLFKDELYKGKERKTIDMKVAELIEFDILNFYPLANIRGMSIFDKIVMLDEAQNTTNHIIKSLVTRVNDTSKLIITGDVEQIDDKNLNKYNNGLTHLVEAGKDEDFIGHITMDIDDKSKRGKLAGFGAKKL